MMMSLRFILLLGFCILWFPPNAGGQMLKKALGDFQGQPIVIKSNSLEFDNQRKMVTFSGNVEAKREDWTIQCQKMIIYYKEKDKDPTQKEGIKDERDKASGQKVNTKQEMIGNDFSHKENMQLDKIVAKGDVKVTRADGGVATAEEATYYWGDERVVLTGKPVVKQGDDFVEGSVVTLFLKENRSVVEGSGDTRVRAVISPRSDKGVPSIGRTP
jgi:lipopolysaccharide export system protein LptA